MGERYLNARDPDDLALLERAAREAAEQRDREAQKAAHLTAEAVRKILGG